MQPGHDNTSWTGNRRTSCSDIASVSNTACATVSHRGSPWVHQGKLLSPRFTTQAVALVALISRNLSQQRPRVKLLTTVATRVVIQLEVLHYAPLECSYKSWHNRSYWAQYCENSPPAAWHSEEPASKCLKQALTIGRLLWLLHDVSQKQSLDVFRFFSVAATDSFLVYGVRHLL